MLMTSAPARDDECYANSPLSRVGEAVPGPPPRARGHLRRTDSSFALRPTIMLARRKSHLRIYGAFAGKVGTSRHIPACHSRLYPGSAAAMLT
jgi:hypothetical protein